MTSSDATPMLLPGRSADAWGRAVAVAGYFTIPVYLSLGFLRVFGRNSDRLFELFWPTIVYGVLAFGTLFVFFVLNARRVSREAGAGYTTQWHGHPTLPQLDAKTGQVIRKAGDAYVKRSTWTQLQSPLPIDLVARAGDSNDRRAPGIGSGILGILPSAIIAVIATAALFGIIGGISGNPFVRVAFAATCVTVVFTLSYSIGGAVVRGRLIRLRAAAPDDFIFVFGKSRGYEEGFMAVTGEPWSSSGYTTRGVSASSTGMTIWHGNPPQAVARLAWDAITSVQVDSIEGRQGTNNSLLITFRTRDGDLETILLGYPKSSSFPVPSKSEVRWIASQLNDLRTASSGARLI